MFYTHNKKEFEKQIELLGAKSEDLIVGLGHIREDDQLPDPRVYRFPRCKVTGLKTRFEYKENGEPDMKNPTTEGILREYSRVSFSFTGKRIFLWELLSE